MKILKMKMYFEAGANLSHNRFNMKNSWFCGLTLILLAGSASAEPFIEPFIGIAKLELRLEDKNAAPDTNPVLAESVANGFFLGMRFGWIFGSKYFAGAEYYQGGPFKDLEAFDTKTTNRMFGFVIGVDFKDVRISATYYNADIFDVDTATASDQSNTGIRVGLGLPISNNRFRANFDVIIHQFAEASLVAGTEKTGQTAQVSLSFPFGLTH